MKHIFIRYSMIILLIGFVALTAGRAYAQVRYSHHDLYLNVWISQDDIARVSLASLADKSDGSKDPVIARIQLLDTEGEVIAQSGEIRVEAGKIRFWDVSRDQIRREGEPGTGRLQMQVRIHITGKPSDLNRDRPPLAPTFELIDPGTGRTLFATTAFFKAETLIVVGAGN